MKVEMAITEQDLAAFGDVAARLEARGIDGAKLVARNGAFADRTMLTLYDETGDPDALDDLVRTMREAAAS